ncbi:unnamed protein product [Clonostachys rosea]|uniref:Hydrophobic surface binding protein A n=1 Tax=Bionectria ochroleuca TaxID=29856 RepID=A0ABY6UXZ8_BIOOC|nr:unnamed protein product [Clonostachys rosea]
MLFAKIFTLGLVALTSAIPLPVKRDFADIQNDFTQIDAQLTSINTKLVAYTGSLGESLALYTDITNLQTLVQGTTQHVIDNGALTVDQSATLNTAGENTVSLLETVLGNVITKLDVIESSGYSDLVFNLLADLKNDVDALFAALANVVDSSYADELAALKARADAAYQAVLDARGTTSKL